MAKYLIKRLIASVIRLGVMGLLFLFVIQVSYVWLGESERNVWDIFLHSETAPESVIASFQGSEDFLSVALRHSLLTILISFLLVSLIGYGWGILGARLRKINLEHLLAFPWMLLSSIPAFWILTLLILYTLYFWDRPAFSNELVVTEGPNYLFFWHACLIACLASFAQIGWLIRSVSFEIKQKAAEPFLRSLYIRGHRREVIFYRNIFRQALQSLSRLFEKSLPALIGAIIPLEWTLQYHGAGSLLVESARYGWFEGIFTIGMAAVSLIIAVALLREIVERLLIKDSVI